MSLYSIGLSGLNAAAAAFNTASNNVSNVNTPGYSRQSVVLATQPASQGVAVQGVQRQFDAYIADQLNAANGRTSALGSYQTQISQIDNLLADEDSGIAPLMQQFFASVATLAGAPSNGAARAGVIGSANTLAAQFRSLGGYLAEMDSGIAGQLRDQVAQINTAANQIANLNQQIALAQARTEQAPNALLDQRDQLVANLGQLVNITKSVQDGGAYNITIGNGQALVAGSTAYALGTLPSAADPSALAIAYQDPAGNLVELADATFTGGTLGGLLTFRDQSLDPVRDQLGQLAVAFATAVNQVQEGGFDLNGDAGTAMFQVGQPVAYANAHNAGTGTLSAAFDPEHAADLAAGSYSLRYLGAGQFEVTAAGGAAQTLAMDPATHALRFGGLTVTVGDPDGIAAGDRFVLQPTRAGAEGFQSVLTNPDLLAAADGAGPGGTGDPGNNQNALRLEGLQTAATVGGRASFNAAYAALVSTVGVQASVVKVNLAAQQSLSDQLTDVQQSESGVSLDEEAVNLVKAQQFYQASAKVIQTGSALLDSLLNLQ